MESFFVVFVDFIIGVVVAVNVLVVPTLVFLWSLCCIPSSATKIYPVLSSLEPTQLGCNHALSLSIAMAYYLVRTPAPHPRTDLFRRKESLASPMCQGWSSNFTCQTIFLYSCGICSYSSAANPAYASLNSRVMTTHRTQDTRQGLAPRT